jgi:RNA polymerase sigma-70 factor (ECF subfamily)
MSTKGNTARAAAEELSMTEGAVRVALHRALQSLNVLYRRGAGGKRMI